MAYSVLTLPSAEKDVLESAASIAQDSPTAAARWVSELQEAILSLAEMPSRCALIPEQGRFARVYRQLHHHAHRIVFFIDEPAQAVVIARVYHGARDRLTGRDLA